MVGGNGSFTPALRRALRAEGTYGGLSLTSHLIRIQRHAGAGADAHDGARSPGRAQCNLYLGIGHMHRGEGLLNRHLCAPTTVVPTTAPYTLRQGRRCMQVLRTAPLSSPQARQPSRQDAGALGARRGAERVIPCGGGAPRAQASSAGVHQATCEGAREPLIASLIACRCPSSYLRGRERATDCLPHCMQVSIKLLARARENQKARGGGGGGGGEADSELKRLKKRLQQLKASGDCLSASDDL